jgi:hypothetical protein
VGKIGRLINDLAADTDGFHRELDRARVACERFAASADAPEVAAEIPPADDPFREFLPGVIDGGEASFTPLPLDGPIFLGEPVVRFVYCSRESFCPDCGAWHHEGTDCVL